MVRGSLRRLLASPAVDVAVRLFVVLSVLGSGFAVWQNTELASCVASYNNANNRRTEVLTVATEQERRAERRADDALAAFITSPLVMKRDRTPAETVELLRLYRELSAALTAQVAERKAADDARRDHPIPDPPSEVCG